jgi:hypothetical protein
MHLAQLKAYPDFPLYCHHYTQLANIKKVQDANKGLQATGYRLQATGYRLQAEG